MGEQPQRGRVGPVQVVEDEQDGTLQGRSREQLGDLVEQPQPCRARVGRGLGVQLAERPQRLDERRERPDGLLVAAAREHGGAGVVRSPRGLRGEARLADPGLAADHHHPPRAVADVVERGEQPVARGVAADERRSLAPGGEGRGERRPGGAGAARGAGGFGVAPADLRDQRARRRRRRDPQLAPQPLREPLVGRHRRGAVARRRQAGDQLAVRLLRQRLERDPLARPRDRAGMVAGRRGGVRERGEQRAARRPVALARGVEPVAGFQAVQERPAPERQRRRRRRVRRVRRVRLHLAQPDLAAGRDEMPVGGCAERAADVRERAAEAGPRGLVEHVRPQPRRQRRARMRPGMQREIPEQRPRRTAVGQRHGPTVDLDDELAEHEHAQHGRRLSAREPAAHGRDLADHLAGEPMQQPRRDAALRLTAVGG